MRSALESQCLNHYLNLRLTYFQTALQPVKLFQCKNIRLNLTSLARLLFKDAQRWLRDCW